MCMVDPHCTVATIWKMRNRQSRTARNSNHSCKGKCESQLYCVYYMAHGSIQILQSYKNYIHYFIYTTKSNSTKFQVTYITVITDN